MTTYRTIDVRHGEIFYREAGDPSGVTLLLLHGYPSSSAQYDRPLGGSQRVSVPQLVSQLPMLQTMPVAQTLPHPPQ